MSAFHVVVRQRDRSRGRALAPLAGFFDVVVDGVNLTARVGEAQAVAVLAELGRAVASLASGRRSRAAVQLYAEDEAWEVGLEADAERVLISVFRGGSEAEVAIHERSVELAALRDGLMLALDEALAGRSDAVAAALASARRLLDEAWPPVARASASRIPWSLTERAGALAVEVRGELRTAPRSEEPGDPSVERADLHALLARGELRLSARGHQVALRGVHPWLAAERLVALGDELLDAWQAGRAMFRRVEAGGARLAVRRGAGDEATALTLSSDELGLDGAVTFPEVSATSLGTLAVRLARGLAAGFQRHDPGQARNLRLLSLLASADALAERLDEACRDDAHRNPDPESYRAFAPPARRSTADGPWQAGACMRFLPRWVATVPGIDLKSTFLCGPTLLVGSARETACIDRASGTVVWRIATARATSVVTPMGLARLHPDGRVVLHEIEAGEPRFCARVAPRVGGAPAGAVVHAPGLPKLLVLAEGDRRITAIDLVSGDVRWRHTARRPASHRIRRAGRLLLVTGGDSALVALDVTSGEVVWRVRDRMRFSGELTVDHDDAFALSGGAGGPATLHVLDPWTGAARWSLSLEDAPAPGQAPLVTSEAVVVVVRDRRGVGARAFSRKTGEPLWAQTPGLCAPTTAWLVVDDCLIANGAAGTLLCLDAQTGNVRYSHVFSRPTDADQPRRLEPVLRSGALFVPQQQVHVVRPRDGELIGTVPTDLIPDLLRVDERCDVYVAEESGHVAAFGVAPRLQLVR